MIYFLKKGTSNMTEKNNEIDMSVANKEITSLNGFFMMSVVFALVAVSVGLFFKWIGAVSVIDFYGSAEIDHPYRWWSIGVFVIALIQLAGFTSIEPREVLVVQLFGTPKGKLSKTGFRWSNPFYSAVTFSKKERNFETNELKVNDANGSPLLVAGVVRWQITDPAALYYSLDDSDEPGVFFSTQAEGNIRNVVKIYPYDVSTEEKEGKDGQEPVQTLTSSTDKITNEILDAINKDVAKFGIRATNVNFNNLSYAPEIANAMTAKQQTKATLDAKKELTKGVTDLIGETLQQIERSSHITLTEQDKSALAKNLTLVLCSGKEVDPVIHID